ncbi:MAG: RlmE family RNA methyltransferase [Candidatus Pacebacteria bacterium]|nr:RlmE family RNA methyltransferase [Candidatus Paceibacterota bacterium]
MKKEFSQRDFYTQKAKEQGYPARSVYKLGEIDEKFKLLQKGFFVLDLGCSPGSWILYISRKIGPIGRVFGADTDKLRVKTPFNATFLQKDIFDVDFLENLKNFGKFDCVVSDLAPKVSGIRDVDAENSSLLCNRSLEICQQVLKQGGNFVCKVLESPQTADFIKQVKSNFVSVKPFKPKASVKFSKEFFVVALKYGKE